MANDRLCIVQNVKNRAVAQVVGWNFNSFARIGNRLIAANEDGLFEITGNTFNDANIDAWIELFFDFGETVRMEHYRLSYETSGTLRLTATVDDRTANAQVINLPPVLTGNKQHGARFAARPHQDKGQYLRLRIANVAGADFSLDKIEATVNVLPRRREGT